MMTGYPIHDLYLRELTPTQQGETQRLLVVRADDYLLRRFGQAEIVQLFPKELPELRARAVADELWALIEGMVEFWWRDLRPDSPTRGVEHTHTTDRPTVVLAPFGVAFGVRAMETSAMLLRLTTHEDGLHPDDRVVPMEATG